MRRFAHLAVIVCLAGSLAACGSSDGDRQTQQADASAATTDRDATLTMALSMPAGNLDPHAYEGVWGVQSMIFEPLVAYGDGGELEPALAESWEVADDGKSITFSLREGVTFTDGTPWDADALHWNFERWITLEDSDWLGVANFYEGGDVIDPLTYRLRLEQPYPQALQELTIVRPVRFLSPASVDEDGAYAEPIGTGPWVVESSDSSRTVLVRNEDHWGELPEVAQVELVVIPDAQSRLSAVRAGDIDVTGGDFVAPLLPQQAVTLAEDPNIEVVDELGTGTLVLGFNPEHEALQDVDVRRAISLAIDREALANTLYAGFAEPAGSLFPESIPFSGDAETATYDLEEAASLLDGAGWSESGGIRSKDGRDLRLRLLSSEEALPGSKAMSTAIQAQLKLVGIDVAVDSVDHATKHERWPAFDYEIAVFQTIGAPYDPLSTLTNYFLSTYDSGVDGKIWVDTDLDPLLEDAVAAMTDDERVTATNRVYDYLADEAALVPLLHPSRIWAHRAAVRGFTIPPTEYDMPASSISMGG